MCPRRDHGSCSARAVADWTDDLQSSTNRARLLLATAATFALPSRSLSRAAAKAQPCHSVSAELGSRSSRDPASNPGSQPIMMDVIDAVRRAFRSPAFKFLLVCFLILLLLIPLLLVNGLIWERESRA